MDAKAQEQIRELVALQVVNESTKWVVSAAVLTTLVLRRDLASMWCVLGAILSAAICKVWLVWYHLRML